MSSMKHNEAPCHMDIKHARSISRIRVASAAATHGFKLHNMLTSRHHLKVGRASTGTSSSVCSCAKCTTSWLQNEEAQSQLLCSCSVRRAADQHSRLQEDIWHAAPIQCQQQQQMEMITITRPSRCESFVAIYVARKSMLQNKRRLLPADVRTTATEHHLSPHRPVPRLLAMTPACRQRHCSATSITST